MAPEPEYPQSALRFTVELTRVATDARPATSVIAVRPVIVASVAAPNPVLVRVKVTGTLACRFAVPLSAAHVCNARTFQGIVANRADCVKNTCLAEKVARARGGT
jgi:hypothetical protein